MSNRFHCDYVQIVAATSTLIRSADRCRLQLEIFVHKISHLTHVRQHVTLERVLHIRWRLVRVEFLEAYP